MCCAWPQLARASEGAASESLNVRWNVIVARRERELLFYPDDAAALLRHARTAEELVQPVVEGLGYFGESGVMAPVLSRPSSQVWAQRGKQLADAMGRAENAARGIDYASHGQQRRTRPGATRAPLVPIEDPLAIQVRNSLVLRTSLAEAQGQLRHVVEDSDIGDRRLSRLAVIGSRLEALGVSGAARYTRAGEDEFLDGHWDQACQQARMLFEEALPGLLSVVVGKPRRTSGTGAVKELWEAGAIASDIGRTMVHGPFALYGLASGKGAHPPSRTEPNQSPAETHEEARYVLDWTADAIEYLIAAIERQMKASVSDA